MKIIVVKGNPNSGKTTSIRLVYDLLLYKGAKIDKPRNSGKIYADFDTELLYNEKRVAINSAGDLLKIYTKQCLTMTAAIFLSRQVAILGGRHLIEYSLATMLCTSKRRSEATRKI